MKLLFSLTLIWTLACTAKALQCQICSDQPCSSTVLKTCASDTICITATVQATSAEGTGTQYYKACAQSSLCPSVGSTNFSVEVAGGGALASAECCKTDDCNSNTLAPPAAQTTNGIQCISCSSTGTCSPLSCKGPETNCFSATITSGSSTVPVLGCISPNTCAAAASLGSIPFMPKVGTITSGPSCCGSSLCNSPTTTTTAPPTTTILTTSTPTTTLATTSARPTTAAKTLSPYPGATNGTHTTQSSSSTTTQTATTPPKQQTTTSNAYRVHFGILNLLLGLFLFFL
ncbi:phospholipase A2 inhibitor and Ly6/PLAUR domain-containing protein-like [Nothobranchius furzeri]|uniref:phospholipase A2 inhibitor and Ly6/PLAUR domain-containing protein-like n=1 Tax=Nothobranchius furzeri TaxID=105023 RepID=UPI00390466B9